MCASHPAIHQPRGTAVHQSAELKKMSQRYLLLSLLFAWTVTIDFPFSPMGAGIVGPEGRYQGVGEYDPVLRSHCRLVEPRD
jgi:hypothetical protein